MKPIRKHYTNGEVTIVWQPDLCIHSRRCVQGLPSVFDFERRPWIDASAGSTAAIEAQVQQCPSGALSCFRNADEPTATAAPAPASTAAPAPEANSGEAAARIEVMPGGPLLISGLVEVFTPDGGSQQHPRTALCRCGHSAKKPYCDGAHRNLPPGWDAESSAAKPA